MPRLTDRVFSDLALWMIGFGLLTGILFPRLCLLLGLPPSSVLTLPFHASTIAAGLAVGAVNFALARGVVGSRLHDLAMGMGRVEVQVARSIDEGAAGCDPIDCALPVDSDDEAGAAAAAFNGLITTLARSRRVEAAMRDFNAGLAQRLPLRELGETALDALLRHVPARSALIIVTDETGVELVARRGACETDDHTEAQLSELVRRGASVIELDAMAAGAAAEAVGLGSDWSRLCLAPIPYSGAPVGVLVLARTAMLAEDERRLVEHFRVALGLAINNTLAHDHLERLAAVDPLTEAYNIRFGKARLSEEMARAARDGSPLGVLMIDLDHFKVVNDTYGHLAGDRVLRAAATACRVVIRDGDVLVRYGGEEFLVLLPATAPDAALAIAQRVRAAIASCVVSCGPHRVGVRASVGVAAYDQGIDGMDGLLGRADAALYAAKRMGRDQVVVDQRYRDGLAGQQALRA